MLAAAHGRDETLAQLLLPTPRIGGAAVGIDGATPGIAGPAPTIAVPSAASGRLSTRDRRGATALMLAAASPSPECVAALIAAGASAGACDDDGRCAIRESRPF
jgi:ankyrin repeat protein